MGRMTGIKGWRRFLRKKSGGLMTICAAKPETFLLCSKNSGDLILPYVALETKLLSRRPNHSKILLRLWHDGWGSVYPETVQSEERG